jgi:hypothetical protein
MLMTRKNLIVVIAVVALAAISFSAFNRASSTQCSASGECPDSKTEENEPVKKSSSGTMIWEAISRQLIASANR